MKIVDYTLMPHREEKAIDSIKTIIVENNDSLQVLKTSIAEAKAWAVDTETHDRIILKSGIWGAVRVISVATKNQNNEYNKYVIDANLFAPLDLEPIFKSTVPAFGWNASFDQEVLELYGIKLNSWRDVMLDESLLYSGFNGRNFHLGLAVAAKRYLNYDVSGKGSVQTSFDDSSPITQEQYDYAAKDALVTLYLGEIVSQLIVENKLEKTSELEQNTREFIYMMETTAGGFCYDMDSWGLYLVDEKVKADDALKAIAKFTNEELEIPSWNVDSDIQLKDKLNQFDKDAVIAYLGRPFSPTDSVDKATLTELKAAGSTLADLVLTYRKPAKLAQTFGVDALSKFYFDGRIRSRYMQCRTSTGRLSSHSPNGQNLPGTLKAFMKAPEGRLMITADYSQAELRVLGYLAQEESWLEAFRSNIDLHDLTAKNMFNIDMDELKKVDPKKAKATRTRVKATNFGMPYNMGATLLARTLTNSGVPTTVFEAKATIDKYYQANPKVSAYLKSRDKFVENFSKNPGEVDWDLSFKLLDLFVTFEGKRRGYKKKFKRYPVASELVDYVNETSKGKSLFEEEESQVDPLILTKLYEDIDWAFRYDAPVVLRPNGDPVAFESRTISGRRRLFTIPMDNGFERTEGFNGSSGSDTSDKFSGVVTVAMLIAATTNKPEAAKVRDAWAEAHGIALPKGVQRTSKTPNEDSKSLREKIRKAQIEERKQSVKAFENKKALKIKYVKDTCEVMGEKAAKFLLDMALADSIQKQIGAFRNHPIQGSVADIAELAFTKLNVMAKNHPDLLWVQTVHDSISGECNAADAKELATMQKKLMEEAMEELLPGIPAKVDAEFGTSLDDQDLIEKIA